MLTFSCPNCEKSWKVKIDSTRSSFYQIIVLKYGNKDQYTLEDPSDPCGECQALAEEAAEEARKRILQKRKK